MRFQLECASRIRCNIQKEVGTGNVPLREAPSSLSLTLCPPAVGFVVHRREGREVLTAGRS
eukprot:2108477-Amphidinium_carterae.1